MVRTILLDMTICGFKCIDNPITIKFTNKTINKNVLNKPQIKAIYGTNGEGKSAIVHSIDVYRKTIIDDSFLTVQSANGALIEIINKKLKKASISVRYIVCFMDDNSDKEEHILCNHTISYAIDNDKKVYIEKEELSIKGKIIFGNNISRLVYKINRGNIEYLNDEFFNDLTEEVKDRTKNLLTKASLLYYLVLDTDFFLNIDKKDKAKYTQLFTNSLLITFFALNTRVYLDEKDSHIIKSDKIRRILKENTFLAETDRSLAAENYDIAVDHEIDEIDKKELPHYKEAVGRICDFLKIFKPGLKEIQVDASSVSNNKYRCKKTLVYEDGNRISSEFESSGIKKLMKLYPVLGVLEYGGIAFIDEFDSNIHDVYLCKIIEYVLYFTQGQLVFTTHNLGPMEVLDDKGIKHSIDFINKSRISSWKRNGNYSVVKVYRGGAIPNCPFNIDSADFVRAFGEKRKD